MEVVERFGVLPRHGRHNPYMVILHDTVSPTVVSAERGLQSRSGGLGYHFIIDNDGTVYQYAHPHERMYHAAGYNTGSIGIACVGGGKYGPVNRIQEEAIITLIDENILPQTPLSILTGHKHASHAGKVDPRFPGEPAEGVDMAIDSQHMDFIAAGTGLRFLRKGEL